MISTAIHTDRLTLVSLDVGDVTEAYRGWMSDPEVTQYLETRFSSPSLESLEAYVAHIRSSTDSYLFGIFDRSTRQHFGNIKLGPVSPVHGTASIGLVLGERAAWGNGFATESIAALSEWAFEQLGLDKLTAGSYRRNFGSVRAFEKCGFAIEGIERSQVRLADGGRDDVVIVGKTLADHRGDAGE